LFLIGALIMVFNIFMTIRAPAAESQRVAFVPAE
jgi:cbb3-type cytochrome oxidase subunit 1